MPTTINDLATSFEVRELTGDERKVRLTGRALPYRPFTLSGTQRNSVEWYPGNPQGVAQVYGAKEEQTTINGMWKDRFLGETDHAPYATVSSANSAGDAIEVFSQTIGTARELCDLFDDIRRKGQLVEVTWLDRVRRGILERFTQKWDNGHDAAWEILFTWTSQGDDVDKISLPSDVTSDLADLPTQAQDLVSQIVGGVASFTTAFDEAYVATVGRVDQAGADIQQITDELAAAAVSASFVAQAPEDVLRRVNGIVDGLKLTSSNLSDLYDQTVDGARLNLGGSFGQVLADRATARGQSSVALSVAALAAQHQQKLLIAARGTVLAVFQAHDGDDLRRVSDKYYGTPDEWRGLMLHNHLTSDRLSAGQTVIVPKTPPRGQP